MNGNIDYNILLKIMELNDIDKEEQLDIFHKIQYVESKVVNEQRDNKSSTLSHKEIMNKSKQNKSNIKL